MLKDREDLELLLLSRSSGGRDDFLKSLPPSLFPKRGLRSSRWSSRFVNGLDDLDSLLLSRSPYEREDFLKSFPPSDFPYVGLRSSPPPSRLPNGFEEVREEERSNFFGPPSFANPLSFRGPAERGDEVRVNLEPLSELSSRFAHGFSSRDSRVLPARFVPDKGRLRSPESSLRLRVDDERRLLSEEPDEDLRPPERPDALRLPIAVGFLFFHVEIFSNGVGFA